MIRQSDQVEPAIYYPATYDPTVPEKRPKQTLAIILALLILILIAAFMLLKNYSSELVITNFTLSTYEADYKENVDVRVKCTNYSFWPQETSYAVCLNDNIVFETELALQPLTSAVKTFTLEGLEDGDYMVSLSGHNIPLTIHKPAKFDVSFAAEQYPLAAGVESPIYYWVENVGESEGTINVEIKADGKTVDTAEHTLGAGAMSRYAAPLLLDTNYQNSVKISLNDVTQKFEVYIPNPAEYEISFASEQYPLVAGVESPVYYWVKNVGEIEGVVSIEIKADGKTIDTAEHTIGPGAMFRYTASLVVEDNGQDSVEISVNGVTKEFEVSPPEKAE